MRPIAASVLSYSIILYMYLLDEIPPELVTELPFTGPKVTSASGLFIKGPIPVWWFQIAWAECRPAAIIFGLILFHLRGMKAKNRPITTNMRAKFGISRYPQTAALEELANARLITLEKRGRRLVPRLDLQSRAPSE
jgi:hypothetical protein